MLRCIQIACLHWVLVSYINTCSLGILLIFLCSILVSFVLLSRKAFTAYSDFNVNISSVLNRFEMLVFEPSGCIVAQN